MHLSVAFLAGLATAASAASASLVAARASDQSCSAAAAISSSFVESLALANAAAASVVQADTISHAQELGLCGGGGSATPATRAALACSAGQKVLDRGSGADSSYITEQTNSTLYFDRVDVNWSSSCWLNATCILQPETAQEVASLVRIIRFYGAKYSTRSGGHNPNPGFASAGPNAILIDMVKLNRLQFRNNNSTIIIGPGNRFGNVYNYTIGSGKFVVGGRVPDVGVSGLFLGGGMPTWSSLYGTAADNIARYEVVLANSTVINATAEQHSDLFWALKGGESNFGIVVEFECNTIDLPLVYYEAVLYNTTHNPQLLSALIEYQAAAEKDQNAGLVWNWAPGELLVGFAYAKPIFRPAIFDAFYAIPNITTYVKGAVAPPTDMALAYSNVSPLYPGRRLIFSIAHETSQEVYETVYAKFLQLAPQAASAYNGSLSFGIQPWTSSASRYGLGKNALGLQPVSQNWMTGVIQWDDPAADQQAFDTINTLANTTKQASVQAGKALDFEYMGDSNYGQKVLRSYGAANFARLQQVSASYDPTKFFQTQQVGGFLLGNS